jgi:hypothetical protein
LFKSLDSAKKKKKFFSFSILKKMNAKTSSENPENNSSASPDSECTIDRTSAPFDRVFLVVDAYDSNDVPKYWHYFLMTDPLAIQIFGATGGLSHEAPFGVPISVLELSEKVSRNQKQYDEVWRPQFLRFISRPAQLGDCTLYIYTNVIGERCFLLQNCPAKNMCQMALLEHSAANVIFDAVFKASKSARKLLLFGLHAGLANKSVFFKT